MNDPYGSLSSNNIKRFEAGIAGAGGGTLFVVLLTDVFPQTPEVNSLIAYLAPSVSVILSALWLTVKKQYQTSRRNKKLQLFLDAINEMLLDPETTEEKAEELRSMRETIKSASIELRFNELKKLFDIQSPEATNEIKDSESTNDLPPSS